MVAEVTEVNVYPGHSYDSINLNHVWTRMGNDTNQSQEWVISPLLLVRLNPLRSFLPVALVSLIEGHWRMFVIGFNPYNVYELFYSNLVYCDVSISLYLGYRIRLYARLLIIVCFFC